MSTQPGTGGECLVPFATAGRRLGRSVWSLRRLYHKGFLPAVTISARWFTYESFIDAVLAATRPGQAAVLEDIARAWFAEREISAGAIVPQPQ
jgi:hypothetical protein